MTEGVSRDAQSVNSKRVVTNSKRDQYNHEIEWYLTEVCSIMGEKSNFCGLVAVIERGGNGGCSGTKGCGITRVEPFENCGALHVTSENGRSIHADFERIRECDETWRRIGQFSRWVLAARYCYSRDKLPPGLHGQLGDLSAVAYVVATRLDGAAANGLTTHVDKLLDGADKRGALRGIEAKAAQALKVAHADWDLFRTAAKW